MTLAVGTPATQAALPRSFADAVRALRRWAPEATTLTAVAWFLVEVTRSWGGREPGVVSIGALLLAVAVTAVRPWRALPVVVPAVAGAVSVAALVVALVAPTGWRGAPGAAMYVTAAWLTVVVAAVVVRRPTMVLPIAVAIAVAAAVEVAEAWLPWWGGEDATQPMVGTFYWHDPYAAFLIPGTLVGLALWTWATRAVAVVGLLATLLGATGILYSTSRAGLACAVLGAAVLTLRAAVSRRWRVVVRSLVAIAGTAVVAVVVAGPPFFPHRVAATGGLAHRAAGESLGRNGGYRLEFWHEALSVFRHHPLTGGGYHSMVAESAGHVPAGWALSPYAHNGYLQPLTDGGLLLALPFLAAVAAIAVVVLRSLVRSRTAAGTELAGFAVPLALGAALAHSAVDFDWTYAANFALTGVLAGLAVGWWLSQRGGEPRPGGGRRLVGASVLGVATASLVVAAWGSRHGDPQQNLPIAQQAAAASSSHARLAPIAQP